MPVKRILAVVAFIAILAVCLGACSSGSGDARSTPVVEDASAPPAVPASVLPRMVTSDADRVDAETIATEVVHPDELRAVLDAAGFSSAVERSFQGGTGPFSRVLARTLAFSTEEGGAAYLDWLRTDASAEIITAKAISPEGLPNGAVAFRHVPDGCCRRDFPVYLAAWPRGSSVVFLHVGGQRATTEAFVDLVATFEAEVGSTG
ncbi:MAG: hypothetical protein WEA54_00670 [Actinomycetota bacterium]